MADVEKDGELNGKSVEDDVNGKEHNRQHDDIDDDVAVFFADADGTKKKKKGLPKWITNIRARDLKILFKCSMAVWIMTVFIFIDETLRVIGQAVFFGWYASLTDRQIRN